MEKIIIETGKRTTLVIEGEIEKDNKNFFVFRIQHAQLFKSVHAVDGYHEVDITHKSNPDFIERQVLKHLKAIHPNKEVIVPPQKKGHFTNILRVLVNNEGYHLEVFRDGRFLPGIFLGSINDVNNNDNIKQNLIGYKKGGARFIYQDNARPSMDPF